jgi:CO/xanthine dehydrogenase FAD-binding subunit
MVNHYIPNTLEEALQYIHQNHTIKVAGGTDVMVKKRNTSNVPPKFEHDAIYLSQLKELNYIKVENEILKIGAMTPLSTVLNHAATPKLLKDAIGVMASPALRNVATLAGNIGNASPAADSVPVLSVYDSLITLKSMNHERKININQVITGPGKTDIKSDELISEIAIPIKNFSKVSFVKVGGRKADAISKICFAAAIQVDKGIVRDFRISIGSVAPRPIRRKDIEEEIKGKSLESLVINRSKIGRLYEPYIIPITDQRSNKDYRKQVSLNIIEDFIQSCKEC